MPGRKPLSDSEKKVRVTVFLLPDDAAYLIGRGFGDLTAGIKSLIDEKRGSRPAAPSSPARAKGDNRCDRCVQFNLHYPECPGCEARRKK